MTERRRDQSRRNNERRNSNPLQRFRQVLDQNLSIMGQSANRLADVGRTVRPDSTGPAATLPPLEVNTNAIARDLRAMGQGLRPSVQRQGTDLMRQNAIAATPSNQLDDFWGPSAARAEGQRRAIVEGMEPGSGYGTPEEVTRGMLRAPAISLSDFDPEYSGTRNLTPNVAYSPNPAAPAPPPPDLGFAGKSIPGGPSPSDPDASYLGRDFNHQPSPEPAEIFIRRSPDLRVNGPDPLGVPPEGEMVRNYGAELQTPDDFFSLVRERLTSLERRRAAEEEARRRSQR